jgi:hypothetical protein
VPNFVVTDDASGDEILRFDDDFVYERGVRVEAPMGGVQFLTRGGVEQLRDWLTEWLNASP